MSSLKPGTQNRGAVRGASPAPPPSAPYSLQGAITALFLGANMIFGANVLLQQRRARRPNRRQWGVAAVTAAVAACAWAVWWRRAQKAAAAQAAAQLSAEAAERCDMESDTREREAGDSSTEVQPGRRV